MQEKIVLFIMVIDYSIKRKVFNNTNFPIVIKMVSKIIRDKKGGVFIQRN